MPPTVLVALVLLAPVLLPLLTAAIYLVAGWGSRTAWLSAGSAVVVLGAVITLAAHVSTSGPRTTAGGLLRADALSAFMLLVVAVVGLVACAATPAHLRGEISAGRARTRTATQHSVLVQVFLSAMALAVLASSLGLLWVAVEATTIVTAFLVGQRRTRAAVEAAWKYVVICSTGIAMALLGTFLLNYAAGRVGAGLDWAGLTANAAGLDSGVTRIAVVLLILGFGTKAGLAPLHSWLPDAHSQAPAPVSALMSGVLLAVAFYAILRVKAIADVTLGTGFARILLAVIALASLLVAATALIAQRDYKRMLAYSSIEHMGLLALGAAIGGPLATAAVLLHMLGHGLAKSTLFLSAGHILQTTGTSQIATVRALATRAPVIACCFAAGVLALIGFPPFSVFASEFALARAGFGTGLGWVTATVFVLVLVIAATLVGHTSRMLLGPSPAGPRPNGPGAATATRTMAASAVATLMVALTVCAAIGVSAPPLDHLLHLAADVLTGTP
jgi:hydrogenase-4 component F